MNFLTSSIVEDRYIAHLVGLSEGEKTIKFADKYHAYQAQKHPITNKIASGLIGTIKGTVLTTFGVLAYPLVNETMRENIFGSTLNVCITCGKNTKSFVDLAIDINRFLQPEKGLSFLKQLTTSYGAGVVVAGKCATQSEMLLAARVVNYAGSIQETISNNFTLIGTVALGLVGLFAISKMHAYSAEECQAEEALKNVLTDRFGKIATRLEDLKANPEIEAFAEKLLERQLEINQEIESLQLPSLTWKEITQITQPVFDAAKGIAGKGTGL
jgi:hypothetical protein